MKRLFKILSLVGLLNISLFAVIQDVDASWVSEYTVTIKKIEMHNSDTNKWIILANTEKAVNIASASAGADIADMVSGDLTIPYGTYTEVRVTLGNQFFVKACGTATNDCTTGASSVAMAPPGSPVALVAVTTTATTPATAATSTVEVDFTERDNFSDLDTAMTNAKATALADGMRIVYTLTSPFIMGASTTSFSGNIAFDIHNILKWEDDGSDLMWVDFPNVTITFQ
ncbi:MAG: DUF4382 domain-containing protein [Arcobacteraceae bacterium]|nr:DUF4382 domain-containing protein [Arcobacteraceae bacterium]